MEQPAPQSQKLAVARPDSIALETARRRPIANEQGADVSVSEATIFAQLNRWNPVRVRVGENNPRYNCHGLAFAALRTGIHESAEVWKILEDDRYEQVDPADVISGDVVLYFSDMEDIEHSGIVIRPPTAVTLNIPLVWSKWGKGPELLHWANQCPYDPSRLRYFRVRL